MPRHRCAWGTCNSDTRYKDREYMSGIKFFSFPRPVPGEDSHLQTIKCKEWINCCGRPGNQLNLTTIHDDYTKKKKYYRICSKVICFPSECKNHIAFKSFLTSDAILYHGSLSPAWWFRLLGAKPLHEHHWQLLLSMGSVKNTNNSGRRIWKHTFDDQGWVRILLKTKEFT